MKKIYNLCLVFVLALTSMSLSAQIPDGSVCPDITFTDIDGNSHRIYDYLDQGKTVVLDLYAVWCGPCWDYHQNGVLKDLYDDNSEDIMVFAVEADPSTQEAWIWTGGGNSIGDWTTGVPYVMANDDAIADAFGLAFYPTIFSICPNRIVTLTGQAGQADFENFADNCPVAVGFDNASVINYSGSNFYCSDIVPEVRVQNMGTDPLTSFDVVVTNGGEEVATTSWEGFLATYDIIDVNVGAIPANDGNNNISVQILNPNGSFDNDDTDNSVSISIGPITNEVQETNQLTINIKTDQYGSETSWDLTLADGTILASGDGYGSNSEYTETVDVNPSDCYVFNIYDSYGDGICCAYGDGAYSVVTSNGETIASGGDYGDGESTAFRNGTFSAPPAPAFAASDDVNGVVTFTNTSVNTDEVISWVWDFGDGSYDFAENPSPHQYEVNGTYTVTLTTTTSSGDTQTYSFDVTVSNVVGINIGNINGLEALNVFPNPASDVVNLTFNFTNTKDLNINITNTLGQIVATVNTDIVKGSNNIEVNTANLAAGLYFINFEAEGQIMAKRISVAH